MYLRARPTAHNDAGAKPTNDHCPRSGPTPEHDVRCTGQATVVGRSWTMARAWHSSPEWASYRRVVARDGVIRKWAFVVARRTVDGI